MRLAIFDLDGTLIDSVALIVQTVSDAFASVNAPVPTEAAIRAISGITSRDAMQILAPDATPERVEQILLSYRTHYRSRAGLAHEPLFKGALDALDRLQADPDTILAVATGKGYQGAVTLLETHGIIGRFHSIQTPDHNRGKPDPQMIETAMSKAGVDRASTVMIGDTIHDMRMARAARVKAIGVAWGYHEVAELTAEGADIVIDSFDRLDAAINELLGSRMREFLDDAHQHRDDGYGRAQAHVRRQLPKRFYKDATVQTVDSGFAVGLDGRVPKTPGMKPVIVPVEAIAAAMAIEWAAQSEFIDPETMPLVRLINSAVEAGEETMPALRAEIVKYAGNDLLLYRADTPDGLVKRQEALWDTALVWLARHFGVSFRPTMGIVHQPQPPATLSRLNDALADEPLLPLTALNAIMSITGSGLLALALRHRLLDAEQVWLAAHVDEDHNIALWGEVEEITTRRAKRRKEFDAAVRLLDMVG